MAGDAGGRLTLISPSDGVLAEVLGPSDAAVTAIASFPGVKKGLVVLAGRGDGSLTWHRLTAPQGGGAPAVEAWGYIPTPATSAWAQLAATPWAGGKHGAANVGGVTAGGAVAWGRIKLEEAGAEIEPAGEEEEAAGAGEGLSITRKKPGKKKRQPRVAATLHWDADFGAGADVALAATLHRAAVQVITGGGEVAWGAVIAKPGYVLRPPFPCTGWARHGTAGLSAAALTASVADADAAAPRHFAAAWGGRLLALHTSATPGTQVCHVTGASVPLVGEATVRAGGGGVLTLAALPGYVLAVTAKGRLAVVNVTGPVLRPAMAAVLQVPLGALAAEVGGAAGAAASPSWWPWPRSAASSALRAVSRPLVAAAGSAAVAAAPSATGVVALQVGPAAVALYGTALPYRPLPRQRPSTRSNWMGALQPIIIAATVGTVLFKQRAQRRQKAAFFQMIQAQAGGGARGGSFLEPPRRGQREQRVARAARAPAPPATSAAAERGSSDDEEAEYQRWLGNSDAMLPDDDGEIGAEDPVLGGGGGGSGGSSAATQPFPWEQREAARRSRVAARFDAIEAEYTATPPPVKPSGGGGGAARREVSAGGLSQRASRAAAAARQVQASPPPLIDRAPPPDGRSPPAPGFPGTELPFSDDSL